MSIFKSIQEGVKNHFDKKKKDREMMDQLEREAQAEQVLMFKKHFKENALEVARAKAKKDAAKLSGLQKLRATNRARRLTESGQNPGSAFSRLTEYTQKNLAKREENLKRSKEMQDTAKKMREDTLAKQQKERSSRMNRSSVRKPFERKPFGRNY